MPTYAALGGDGEGNGARSSSVASSSQGTRSVFALVLSHRMPSVVIALRDTKGILAGGVPVGPGNRVAWLDRPAGSAV